MPAQFRDRRALYYGVDPEPAIALRRYHLSEQESVGLHATETRHPPRFDIPSHAHDLHSFYFVLEGGLSEYGDRVRHDVPAASLMFTPAGHIHRNSFHDSGGRCFLVEMTPAWSSRLSATGMFLDRPTVAASSELTRLGASLYREVRSGSESPLLVEGLVLEILGQLAQSSPVFTGLPQSSPAPAWLIRARELVHDCVADRLTLADLAGAVGVHPVRLARAFRSRFRASPGEYQRRLRVDFAARQLATTARPLAGIALAAGFADQAHFCRVFKRHTGFTPAEFRTRFTTA